MIYFLKAEGSDFVKIGWTKDERTLANRISDLQTGQPFRLSVLRTLEAQRWAEAWLHGFFTGLRAAGEWFRFDEQMLTVQPPDQKPPKPKPVSIRLKAAVKIKMGKYRRNYPAVSERTGELTEDDVRARLAQACNEAGGQRPWARMHKITEGSVSDVLARRREPSPKICAALDIEKDTTPRYRKRVPS